MDAAQIYCEKCRPKEKKARKPRKKKEETPMPVTVQTAEPPTIEDLAEKFNAMPKPAIDLQALRLNAQKWAEECGLKNVAVSEATRENYNRYGYGFIFSVRGQSVTGKDRMATARYTYTGGGR